MTDHFHVNCLTEYCIEYGFHLSPNVIPVLMQLHKPDIDNILNLIKSRKPETIVIDLQTISDITGIWFVNYGTEWSGV